jgi:hypothetical protein
VFYGLVAALALTALVEISGQVFARSNGPVPYATCREGLLALAAAVDRARGAAGGDDGEAAAIGRFRAALEPEWSARDGVATLCGRDDADRGALDAILRLRYAEEHAARKEAGDLAPLRRRVRAIVERGAGATVPPGAPGE